MISMCRDWPGTRSQNALAEICRGHPHCSWTVRDISFTFASPAPSWPLQSPFPTSSPPLPNSSTSQIFSFARRSRVSRFVRDECLNRGGHAHLSTINQRKNVVRDCLAPPRLNTPQPQSSRRSSLPAPVAPSLELGRPTSDVCDGSAAVAKP